MRLNKILSLVLVSAVMVVASLPAEAQGKKLGIGFSKFGKKTSISVGISTGHVTGGLTILPPHRRPPLHVPPGRFVTRCYQVWVPGCGCSKTIFIEPVYDICVDPCGNVSRVLISEGYSKVVFDSGHFETRCTQVWVPGSYP